MLCGIISLVEYGSTFRITHEAVDPRGEKGPGPSATKDVSQHELTGLTRGFVLVLFGGKYALAY